MRKGKRKIKSCHCEPRRRRGEANSLFIDCFASLAMTKAGTSLLILTILSTSVFAQDNSTIANVLAEGLRDVKAPVSFPPSFVFLFFLLGLLVAVSLFFLLRHLMNKKKEVEAAPVDMRLPWQIALEQFEELSRTSLLSQGQLKEYYSQLSGIIRTYFENQFNVRAPEMTSEEFLWSLDKSQSLNEDQKATLKKFMDSCDIVKFAKYVPGLEEAEESFALARQLVEETKFV